MKTKAGILCLVLVLCLIGSAVGLALWSDTLTISGTVNTGNIDPVFTAAVSNDDARIVDHHPLTDTAHERECICEEHLCLKPGQPGIVSDKQSPAVRKHKPRTLCRDSFFAQYQLMGRGIVLHLDTGLECGREHTHSRYRAASRHRARMCMLPPFACGVP